MIKLIILFCISLIANAKNECRPTWERNFCADYDNCIYNTRNCLLLWNAKENSIVKDNCKIVSGIWTDYYTKEDLLGSFKSRNYRN